MMEITDVLSHGDMEYDIRILDGSIKGGAKYAEKVEISDGDLKRVAILSLEEEVHESEIKDHLLPGLVEKILHMEETVNTGDPDYTEPRFVNEGTNKAKILLSIYRMFPTTNELVAHYTDIEGVSAYTSKLRDDNLVAYVGNENKSRVIVPTHVGMKEVYCLRGGIPDTKVSDRERGGKETDQTGLDGLFEGEASDGEA